MGAQGDQAAPKAPKLKPSDAQSLPKVVQGSPETSKVFWKDPTMSPKVLGNHEKSIKKHN